MLKTASDSCQSGDSLLAQIAVQYVTILGKRPSSCMLYSDRECYVHQLALVDSIRTFTSTCAPHGLSKTNIERQLIDLSLGPGSKQKDYPE